MPIMSTKPEQNVGVDVDLDMECMFPCWRSLPDHILLQVFTFLDAPTLAQAGLVCKSWLRVAFDELLWKDLFYRHYSISRSIPMAPGKYSWIQEYKRLLYHTPAVESEVLKQHADQVLHVSFSHNGKMFATCSKDGFIRVWDATYPTSIKYKADMRRFTWKYTQFSQFNSTDTLLLVSGVHFGSLSTSGEIAVFSLDGEFVMQSRVMNKPYDVFGTWYNDFYLLSGNLHWTGHLNSCSAIWLNKAYQETGSEEESVVMRLFKFSNINASSIRTIMVANCLNEESTLASPDNITDGGSTVGGSDVSLPVIGEQPTNQEEEDMQDSPEIEESDSIEPKDNEEQEEKPQKALQGIQVFENGEFITKYLEVDEDVPNNKLNGTIEYSSDYRLAEGPKIRRMRGQSEYTSGSDHSTNGNHCGSEISEKSVNGACIDTFDQSQLLSEIETACGKDSKPDQEDMHVDPALPSNSCHGSVRTEQVVLEAVLPGPSSKCDPSPSLQPTSKGGSICERCGSDSQSMTLTPARTMTLGQARAMTLTSARNDGDLGTSDNTEGTEITVSSQSATPKRVLHGQQPEQGDIVQDPSTGDLKEVTNRADSMDELPQRQHKIHFCCVDYKKQKKVSPVRNSSEKYMSKPKLSAEKLSVVSIENQSVSDTHSDCVPGRSQARLCAKSGDKTGSEMLVDCVPSRHSRAEQTASRAGAESANRKQLDSRNQSDTEQKSSCVPKAAQSRLCLGSATLSIEHMDDQPSLEVNRCLPVQSQCNNQSSTSQYLGNQSNTSTAPTGTCRQGSEARLVLPVPHSRYEMNRCGKTGKGKKIKDKYLIFTKGSETYTPHQIGIKRIKPMRAFSKDGSRLLPNVTDTTYNVDQGEVYDEVDHLIDMHGHIIGMTLSPDQRYLYVNSRPWPKRYFIENPLYPPPIAQQIDIHVIDLLNMREVGTMHRSHKAYTSNDECFFIFLDVCEEYVASGAEDKHGYLWDRHYGLCLHKYPHTDVVNSVAFNPADPEVLVTVSDDFSIKIWRSLSREKEVVKAFNKEHSIRLKQVQAMVSDTRQYSEQADSSSTDVT